MPTSSGAIDKKKAQPTFRRPGRFNASIDAATPRRRDAATV